MFRCVRDTVVVVVVVVQQHTSLAVVLSVWSWIIGVVSTLD